MRADDWQPFVYWSQRRHHAPAGVCDSVAQRHCYVLWHQEQGTGRVIAAGGALTLRPGQVCLADPGSRLEWTAPAVFSRLAFDLVPRQRVQRQPRRPEWEQDPWRAQPGLDAVFCPGLRGVLGADEARAAAHLVATVRATYWRSPGDHLWCCSLLGQWLLDLARERGAALFARRNARRARTLADRVDEVIADQLSARLGVAEIAAHLGLSREHLSRTYSTLRQMPLARAIALRRLRNAESLLRGTDLAVAAIAARSGFRSAAAMREEFMRAHACTPRGFRERHRR